MTMSDVKATLSFSDGSPSMELPIYKGYYVEDLRTLPLGRWDERGCDAAFLQLAKGYAAVLGVNQIERARNDRAIFKSQAAHRPGLARLIH